jgi:hypothetical protein
MKGVKAMKLVTLMLALLLAAANSFSQTVANKKAGEHFCGTQSPKQDEAQAVNLLLNEYKKTVRFRELASRTTPINIPVYVHIIRSDDGTQGNVQLADVEATIQALNNAYLGRFTFTLMNFHYVDNTTWFLSSYATPEIELEMRQVLHVGGRSTLNIYSQNLSDFSFGGYAYFPWQIYPSGQGVIDGVTLKYNNFSHPVGRPAVTPHEVGHWLGMLHTFQDECSAVNDYVADTPAEKLPTACIEDSCPSLPGTDLIDNYMGYRNVMGCVAPTANRFTDGQWESMLAMYGMLRSELAPPAFSVRTFSLAYAFQQVPVYVSGPRYQSELVEFNVTGLPAGTTYTLPSRYCRRSNCNSILRISFTGPTKPGDYLLTVTANAKRGAASTQTVLRVQ